MIECLGDEPCHFVEILDNGSFPELGSVSITDWIAHIPKPLLAKNFGVPESTFDGFPEKEVFFPRGALPAQKPAAPLGRPKPPPQTHKWQLLAQAPIYERKGERMWLVDSQNFPIAKTITGSLLELAPGALRELHWHPSADEWQYVLEGEVSVTMFGPGGRYRTETLEKGDVGYIPQGYGHSLENVGDKSCRVLVAFNSGVYESIALSEWIAGNPPDVLATNFGVPAARFEKFRH
jgi:oxalate decarboxylase